MWLILFCMWMWLNLFFSMCLIVFEIFEMVNFGVLLLGVLFLKRFMFVVLV